MVVAVIAVLVKINILLSSIALVERLLVALALGQGRFKVDNAPSFNDLQEG